MSKKYTIRGEAVEVLHAVTGGHIVAQLYDSGDGEQQDAPHFTGEQLFDSAPTKQLEARVAEIESRILEVQTKRASLDHELRQAEANHGKVMARFKSTPALEHLHDYLDGKITHLVIDVGYDVPCIAEFSKEIQSDQCKYERKLRLLSLYGDSKGDLQWHLSYYSDGSGTTRRVYPFISLEAAETKAKELVESLAIATDQHPQERVIRGAKLFGVTLPKDYERRYLESIINGNADSIAKAQSDLDARKQSIESMKGRLIEITQPAAA